jgi:hypothetical protein
MKIKFKEYTLEPEGARYNLYKTVQATNKKTNEKYDTEQNIGYGMTMETAIDIMAKDILNDVQAIVSLETYLQKYKEIVNEILTKIGE